MSCDQKLSLQEIREYWTLQAKEHGESHEASWSDQMVIEMEIDEISKHVEDGDRVLDVGCANGYSTVRWATSKSISIKGVDYIEGMIESAQRRLEGIGSRLQGETSFEVGNILSLNEKPQSYDKVIVVRVIINLREWAHQLQGIMECCRVLKPGGTLLLSEATIQGWQRMNQFRAEWGLAPIPMPSFNNYLDEKKIVESLSPSMQLVSIVNFASTYYVGTRVFKPLLATLLGMKDKIADPKMEWNRWFSQLPASGDYGPQKLFVFRKL